MELVKLVIISAERGCGGVAPPWPSSKEGGMPSPLGLGRAKAEIGRRAADPTQDRSSPERGGFMREGWVPFPWGNPRGWLRAGPGSPEALFAAQTPTAEIPGGRGGIWAVGKGFEKTF